MHVDVRESPHDCQRMSGTAEWHELRKPALRDLGVIALLVSQAGKVAFSTYRLYRTRRCTYQVTSAVSAVR